MISSPAAGLQAARTISLGLRGCGVEQKRAERLIDVPSSIAAVGEQVIKDLNVRQLAEPSNHVPNLR